MMIAFAYSLYGLLYSQNVCPPMKIKIVDRSVIIIKNTFPMKIYHSEQV